MGSVSALLVRADHCEPSVFVAENLLREARRQLSLQAGAVPKVCLLDPDGDVARHVQRAGLGVRSPVWACYHTDLLEVSVPSGTAGIVGSAVGAPFAVLVAEELFASGCELLISLTSAGRIATEIPQSCIVVIDRAIRGEGTSHSYIPPGDSVDSDPALARLAFESINGLGIPVLKGMSWTTDAPFRETKSAITAAAQQGALAVEMEAAALYAFAQARKAPVVCLAHVTNDMAVETGDFEKGVSNGADQALSIVDAIARAYFHDREPDERCKP
ncbi:hypothetical protein BH23CHL4_BH23CHL4_14020 [soil metagenome]